MIYEHSKSLINELLQTTMEWKESNTLHQVQYWDKEKRSAIQDWVYEPESDSMIIVRMSADIWELPSRLRRDYSNAVIVSDRKPMLGAKKVVKN